MVAVDFDGAPWKRISNTDAPAGSTETPRYTFVVVAGAEAPGAAESELLQLAAPMSNVHAPTRVAGRTARSASRRRVTGREDRWRMVASRKEIPGSGRPHVTVGQGCCHAPPSVIPLR